MSALLARRALLQAAALSVLGGLPLSFVSCSEDAKRFSGSDPRIVEGYFAGDRLAGARVIGEHWLRAVAPAATRAEIRELVRPTEELTAESTDLAGAIATLRARVAADFESARLVDVQGWVLALTEVHLCVIAGLRNA